MIMKVYFFSFCCGVFLFHSSLFADIIKMKDGRILCGKILQITSESYTLQRPDASVQNIDKTQIVELEFSVRDNHMAYASDYFTRLYASVGSSTYSEEKVEQKDKKKTLSKGQKSSYHVPMRWGLDMGRMLVRNTLSMSSGLEYNRSYLVKPKKFGYSYLSLTVSLTLVLGPMLLGHAH